MGPDRPGGYRHEESREQRSMSEHFGFNAVQPTRPQAAYGTESQAEIV
jgi:hypothetical protein